MKPYFTHSELSASPHRKLALAQLSALILQQKTSHPLRVAIDGVDAAGKTRLADELAALLVEARPVIRATIDAFHRPRADRYRQGSSSPLGYYQDSFDYPAFINALLLPLGPGGDRLYHLAAFDYRLDVPVESELMRAPEDAILLVDGIFLNRPELGRYWDFCIFIKVDFRISLQRALQRVVEEQDGKPLSPGFVTELEQRYESRYIPGQKIYLQQARPQEFSHVVWDGNDLDRPRLAIRPDPA